MANAILNFHFDYPHPSLTFILSNATSPKWIIGCQIIKTAGLSCLAASMLLYSLICYSLLDVFVTSFSLHFFILIDLDWTLVGEFYNTIIYLYKITTSAISFYDTKTTSTSGMLQYLQRVYYCRINCILRYHRSYRLMWFQPREASFGTRLLYLGFFRLGQGGVVV